MTLSSSLPPTGPAARGRRCGQEPVPPRHSQSLPSVPESTRAGPPSAHWHHCCRVPSAEQAAFTLGKFSSILGSRPASTPGSLPAQTTYREHALKDMQHRAPSSGCLQGQITYGREPQQRYEQLLTPQDDIGDSLRSHRRNRPPYCQGSCLPLPAGMHAGDPGYSASWGSAAGVVGECRRRREGPA